MNGLVGHFVDHRRPIALAISTQFDKHAIQVWGIAYMWAVISKLRLKDRFRRITRPKSGPQPLI